MDLTSEWTAAMRRGDFLNAWTVSDVVLAAHPVNGRDWQLPRHQQRIWDGRPLANQRVLVRCYHGLGDTLQFARFWPAASKLARELTIWAQPALIPLLRTMDLRAVFLPL